jgi:hypothetical protein
MIGQYKILRQLGDGTFGVGMLAQDTTKNNMLVCVKLFKGVAPEIEESFNTEVSAGKA